jgi:hypothetical protein
MNSLLLLDGSPRGSRSNTSRMLARVTEGWVSAAGESPTLLHLANSADFERAVAAFGAAETVVLGTPLYTDSMPALVKRFVEALAPRVGRDDNPRLGFLIQSGFDEPLHSRYLERYFEKLARRLGSPYAGTIVRGSGEALQVMPDEACKRLFGHLRSCGAELASDGEFSAATLAAIAGKERLAGLKLQLYRVVQHTPLASFYWDSQLKKNGAWVQRFAAPYAEAPR